MPRFGFAQLLCFMLLTGAFLVFGSDRSEADVGLASWYGPEFEGRETASGEVYDPNGYTAAHKTLPLGTDLIVSYGQRSVPVTVNDRGPFLGTRELDLSRAAARDVGLIPDGVGYVEYDVVGSPGFDPSRQAAQPPVPSQTAAQQPGLPQGVAQQPGPSQGAAQQPELTQGAAQLAQPTLSQGVSQQPNPVQEAAQQSNPLRGAAQQPGLSQTTEDPRPPTQPGFLGEATQQPELTQGTTQQPDPSRGATQELAPSQGVAQQPDLSQGAAQQPALSQGVVQEPGITQEAAQQDEANGGTYVVQPGDTLARIATRLGIPADHLARYNGITDPDVIYSGQPIYFLALENGPVGAGGNPATNDAAIYNPLEAVDNATIAGPEVAGNYVQTGGSDIATGFTSENEELWVPDRTVTSNGAAIGGERRMLPATGSGYRGS